jgi:hypothetical protein
MKAEKIEKHYMRQTVVATNPGTELGVLTKIQYGVEPRGFVAGVSRKHDNAPFDEWCAAKSVRKATDAERAEFFVWLVSDGRDIATRFARFGGMPRGFEAWRAAQDAPVEPWAICASGCAPTASAPWRALRRTRMAW